jgi:glycine/D-amino acid oxidase-like deaminating enzyme
MKLDYLVIGSGLAGMAFCELLLKKNRSFVVVEDNSQKSSTVAGGLYNPVILKRFTKVWKAREQLQLAIPFYNSLEKKFNQQFDFKIPIYRLFASIEEQNNWFQASDDKVLSEFLATDLINIEHQYIKSDFGFGRVLQTGRINTSLLINAYREYLIDQDRFLEETFDYTQLEFKEESVMYRSMEATHVVFAEGYGLKKNPFFNDLPLNGTKGELLSIYAPDLKIDFILKSNVFLIPFGEDIYGVGATYERTDKSNEPTEKAREELITKLDKVISCKYAVISQSAGIRPTVRDRRPLVGQHKEFKQLFVLNGLGTRGVMIAPYIAKQLISHIEDSKPLDHEIDIKRFD